MAASRRAERVLEAARARLLDVRAGVVDEVHVVDAARAGGHAGQAGQAAVDVVLHLRGWPCGRARTSPSSGRCGRAGCRARRRAARRSGRWRCRSRSARSLRRILSTSAMRGFCSCLGVKLVCMGRGRAVFQKVGVHAAGIEDAGRVEGGLELARELLDAGLERLEHLDRRAHLRLGADQRGMAAVGGDDAADVGGAGIGGRRAPRPRPGRPTSRRRRGTPCRR